MIRLVDRIVANAVHSGASDIHIHPEEKILHSTNEWHHLTGVGDGANMYIYVDGVEVASRVYATAGYGTNSNPFHIGAKSLTAGNHFTGLIDEVLVYDRALSAGEISQLYTGSVPQ